MVRLGLLIAAAVVALDQLTKWLILEYVMNPPRLIEVLPFFNLVLVWNRGVSFGLFGADAAIVPWALSGLALVIVAVLAVWLARTDRAIVAGALGLVIGGAIGNVIDRVRFGAVVDFLDFHAFGWHWPAFNVADSAITIGVVLLVLDSLQSSRKRT